MARTKGTFNISANIETNASAPLDARERVSTKEDLTASGSFPYFYEGMQVYVVAEQKRYTLKGSDPTVLANWEENGSGGSSITVDEELSNLSENPVQNKAIKAGLDAKADLVDGKIPANQLPSYVDDVKQGYLYNGVFYEDSAHQTVIPAEADKIYIELTSNKTYRWSGSDYVEISESLALGETSSTAYRGDRGKTAYDDSQTNKAAIGTLSNLLTTAKNNLVAAINELFNGKQKNISAGNGISKTTGTTTDTIAADIMPSTDMGEIMTPLPGVTPKWHKWSTEEQAIGTWIDGTTVYEKTWSIGLSAYSDGTDHYIMLLDVSTLGIKPIKCDGMVDKGTISIASGFRNDTRHLSIGANSNKVFLYSNLSFTATDYAIFTLQYTKV